MYFYKPTVNLIQLQWWVSLTWILGLRTNEYNYKSFCVMEKKSSLIEHCHTIRVSCFGTEYITQHLEKNRKPWTYDNISFCWQHFLILWWNCVHNMLFYSLNENSNHILIFNFLTYIPDSCVGFFVCLFFSFPCQDDLFVCFFVCLCN